MHSHRAIPKVRSGNARWNARYNLPSSPVGEMLGLAIEDDPRGLRSYGHAGKACIEKATVRQPADELPV